MSRRRVSVWLLLTVSSITTASQTGAGGPSPGPASLPSQTLAAAPVGASESRPSVRPEVCYAPGTSPEVVPKNARRGALATSLRGDGFQFSDSSRWTGTASDGGGLTQGQVTTLTWNIVPDGTPIAALGGIAGESTTASNLKAFLNGIYGSEAAWLAHLQTVFDQWGALTGVTYVKVNYDDGASLANGGAFPYNPGVLGTRADVRIGGHRIDGNSNVLAYNFFPNVGDMVLDTGDNYYSTSGIANGSWPFATYWLTNTAMGWPSNTRARSTRRSSWSRLFPRVSPTPSLTTSSPPGAAMATTRKRTTLP